MGSHPINLGFRFLLEIAALFAIGFWAWELGESWIKYLGAIGFPVFAAVIWGIFNVPGDPSRSGKAPVKVHGIIRLIIELLIFSFAVWTLNNIEKNSLALILGILVMIHYLLSIDRIKWLVKSK